MSDTSGKTSEPGAKPSFWTTLKGFADRPVAVMLGLAFASGLPLSLIFDTLSIWLRDAELSLESIGYFSLVTFSYSLKFVWAPVVDRVRLPMLTKMLGHRRSWILLMQTIIVLGLWTISGLNPKDHLALMALVAVLIGFAGATQDIVIDAWRIETAGENPDKQAILATAHGWGSRIAPFAAGIIPLVLADRLGWGFAYALMAAFMGIGILAVLFAPEAQAHKIRPINYGTALQQPVTEGLEWAGRLALIVLAVALMGAGLTAKLVLFKPLFAMFDATGGTFEALNKVWTSKATGIFLQFPAVLSGLALMFIACLPLPGTLTRPGAYLKQTFVEPIADFFSRYQNLATLILVTICVYRVSDFLLNINVAFYLDLGFDKDTIASVRKVFGIAMSMVGVGIGGFVMLRFGMNTALIIGAVVGALSNLGYAWLATKGNDLFAFSVALGLDNISASIAGTVLIAYMSSLISKGFAAPQYALFTSLYALPGKLLASQSGRIVDSTARAVDAAGPSPFFASLFADLPASAYAKPAAVANIAPMAFGTGYVIFFVYTTLIGISAILLSLWLIHATRKAQAAAVRTE